jgi:TRAP-type C4-dicarboxylate transport system permease small subunit
MIALIFRAARWSAIFGGVILASIMLMIVFSITGRALDFLGLGPIPGDFELVEVGTAVAVFLFLPWCFLKAGHASVDLVFNHMPKKIQHFIVTFSDVLMLAFWLVLSQRLWVGMLEKKEYFETTFILLMPLWWGYALCMVGAVIGCLAYFAKVLIDFRLAQYPKGWVFDTTGAH